MKPEIVNPQNPEQGPDRRGVALIVCAPSGAGKTTLLRRLREEFPRFTYSVSYTTRDPREGEVHGKDYYFVGKDEFLEKRDHGFFAEWAQVHDNFYGTPIDEVRQLLNEGADVLFDIDIQGARQLKESVPGVYAFVFPPSIEELESRLCGRGTDVEAVIRKRLANARDEIASAAMFDYWIINDDLDTAYDELRSAFIAETVRPQRRAWHLEALLAQWPE